MDVVIRPEPDDDEEREAIVAAVARAGVETPHPPGYDSPWRNAGFLDVAEDDPEP